MTPEQYRAGQNRVNKQAAVAILSIMRVANPKTDRQWVRLAELIFAAIASPREDSYQLGLAYFASLAPQGNAPNLPIPAYTPRMTEKALNRFRPDWEEAAASERSKLTVGATAAMVRHTEQAGRETVVQAARRDGARFARYDPRPPCCAFCTLMISRGPVYWSRESGGFLAHDHDTCVPVPVFEGQRDWPGKAQFEAAERFYSEYAAGAGPGKQLVAMRQAVSTQGSPI